MRLKLQDLIIVILLNVLEVIICKIIIRFINGDLYNVIMNNVDSRVVRKLALLSERAWF